MMNCIYGKERKKQGWNFTETIIKIISGWVLLNNLF